MLRASIRIGASRNHDAQFGDLQRGGESRVLHGDIDPCNNISPAGPDSLIA